jgi:hypothetical protein
LDQVLDKTKGMRLMGQRFVPDAWMFQQLVAPAVGLFTATDSPFTMEFTAAGPLRCFPRGLDVMAALGSWRALTILDQEDDTAYIGYDRKMNEIIAQFRSFDEPAWHRNLYWGWLHALQTLLTPCGSGYPPFMQQAAWQDKQLNTALASWTQLRHDTILYAKQSNTSGTIGLPPPPDRGYVEPVPALLNRLLCLTRMMKAGLADMGVLSEEQQEGLLGFERILTRLLQIAMAELEGRALSEPDYDYIKGLFGQDLLAAVMPVFQTATSPDARPLDVPLVADVHTDGNTGKVLEEGVGHVRVLVAAYRIPEGRVVLGVGPVFSHYEFKWPMGDRLTDEKWTNMLANGQCPPDPPWTRSFAWPVALPADDADGDRLPDAWEDEVWGSNPSVRDPNADTDGDGLTDLEEYMAGTNPRLRDSALRVTNIRLTGQAAVLYWPAVPGRRYRVFQSSDLRNWQLLGCPVSALGAACSLVDVDVSAEGQRFYRVAVLP